MHLCFGLPIAGHKDRIALGTEDKAVSRLSGTNIPRYVAILISSSAVISDGLSGESSFERDRQREREEERTNACNRDICAARG